jgi:hypothetical protein
MGILLSNSGIQKVDYAPVRAYDYALGQQITLVDGTAVRSTAVGRVNVLLHAVGSRVYFRVGDNTVTATIGAGSIPLEVGEKFHIALNANQFISVIRDGAVNAIVTILPCVD